MAAQETLYPLEFVLASTPLSLQASARSKERWKAAVRAAARERITATDELGFLDRRPLSLTIHYFPERAMQGDVDNIVKPIMDALIGVAFLDDRDVERVAVQKFEPQFDWSFVMPSEVLSTALDGTPPIVYIRVADDLGWRRLP